MDSATPKRQTTLTNLQSTPQSAGSAARGKDLTTTGLPVHVVGPWIARDIENAQRCEVDLMLKSFLLDCMVDESSTMEQANSLFQTCIDRVLPICNSTYITGHLEAYSKAASETSLYPHFVNAANKALSLLEGLDGIDKLRKPSEQLAFQVYGKEITQIHQGAISARKPDVILVSSDSIRDAGKDLIVAAAEQPKKNFTWREVRAAIELKIRRDIKSPPSQYTNDDYIQPSRTCQYLPSNHFNDDSTIEPPSTSSQQESQSNNVGNKEPSPGTSGNTATRKRKADTRKDQRESHLKPGEQSNKGSGSSSKRQRAEPNPSKISPATQTGLYGSEMFASHAGRHHVISITVLGDLLYIWRYDRQNAIQCSALNFIQDLPCFLVLLLTLQRFENRHWGLNPILDSKFGELSSHPTLALIEDEKEGQVDIALDLSSDERSRHFGIAGRATNVCPVTSQKFAVMGELVAKFYWRETSRVSEPDILKKVYEIAEVEPDVQNHVPVMVFYYNFPESSTATIRSRLELPKEGARELILILFKKLMKITKLIGDPFLSSWWQTVKCHLALWKNSVYHRDVSVSNLMYKGGADGVVGVLNDFDLATLTQVPTGTERTGTIPFMAQQLLTDKGMAGKIKHIYAHDAESFIWVLLWVCARYSDGLLIPGKAPFDEWLKVDAKGCGEKRSWYLLGRDEDIKPGTGHEKSWLVAQKGLDALLQQISSRAPSDETCDKPFQSLLAGPYTTVCESG